MIYLFLLLLLIIGVVKYDGKVDYNKENSRYLYFVGIVMVLIVGLRYKIGGDTISYYYGYESWPDLAHLTKSFIQDSRYNILFCLFWSACKSLSKEFWVYQVISAILVNGTIIWFFKKHTKRVFLALLLFSIYRYLFYNTEIIRASLSVVSFLLVFDSLLERKWVKYYVYVAIAIGFHSEAIVLLLYPIALLLSKLRMSIRNLLIVVLVPYVLLVATDLLPFVNSIFMSIEALSDVMAGYYQNLRVGLNMNAYILSFVSIAPVVLSMYINRDNENQRYNGFLVLYVFFAVQSLKYTVFMGRSMDFLFPIEILSIVSAYEYVKDTCNFKVLKIATLSIALFVCSNTFVYIKNHDYPDWKKYYPYSSVLSPEENPEREFAVSDQIINR